MKMITKYEAMIASGDIDDDPLQRDLIKQFQLVADELRRNRRSWFRLNDKKQVKGLYLHGPVGAGKTFLMDLFYETVLERKKKRLHLHEFMQQIDAELREIQGQVNPLRRIAADIAKTSRLLCFDEFVVNDIATAMILAELLRYLFANGVVLVATSNSKPDDLYLNGLQRTRFLPAIALIKAQCLVLSLVEKRDYRLGREQLREAYFYPHDEHTMNTLNQQFLESITGDVKNTDVLVQGRDIPCIKRSNNVIWFDFNVICNLPRSQLDYLEIAKRFDTVFVSDIPKLGANDTVAALLLIHFIDVMYDQGARLILSAAVAVDDLYLDGELTSSFRRTRSRLHEMQSLDYLNR